MKSSLVRIRPTGNLLFIRFRFQKLTSMKSYQTTGKYTKVVFKVKVDLRVINKGLQIELDNKVNKATK